MKKKIFFAALILFMIGVLMVGRGRQNKEYIPPYTMPKATPPSTTDSSRQCKAIKRDKKRCPTKTRFTNGYCATHQALYKDSTVLIP